MLGRNPSVRLLRLLSKAVVNMEIQGRSDHIVGNAYKFMQSEVSKHDTGRDALGKLYAPAPVTG